MTETADTPSGIRIERMLPLYEAKMIHQFDHRWASYHEGFDSVTNGDHRDPESRAQPRYWLPSTAVSDAFTGDVSPVLTGFRDIARNTDERTVLAGALPLAGVGHTYPLFFCANQSDLLAILNALPLDFVARQKVAGLHLTYGYVKQFPVPRPEAFPESLRFDQTHRSGSWVGTRSLELTYTAWDMAPFAEDMGDVDETGRVRPPFVWDPERRFLLRCELDAAFFHLYGIDRDDVDYIMDTFPIVRRKDMESHGEYRTKRVILEMYDAMQQAIDSGVAYQTPITPPPGEGPRHPPREHSDDS